MEQNACACPLTRGERILIALDGSENGDKALEQAFSMAGLCNSELTAISVVPMYPEQMAVAPALEEKLSKEAHDTLEAAKAKAEKAGYTLETVVRIDGQPHVPIVEEARNRNTDMIVVGRHGKSGLADLLLGSVSQRVIANSPCVVMVTPT